MLTHAFPFSFVERTRLLKDLIGDGDLAHVVQKRASFEVGEFFFAKTNLLCHFYGDLGHALSMSLGFAVAQVERAHPAFDGSFVGITQLVVGDVAALLRLVCVR